jgi:hypothetical protein
LTLNLAVNAVFRAQENFHNNIKQLLLVHPADKVGFPLKCRASSLLLRFEESTAVRHACWTLLSTCSNTALGSVLCDAS